VFILKYEFKILKQTSVVFYGFIFFILMVGNNDVFK